MHEMSVCSSLLEIVGQEMEKHGVTRLLKVKVVFGKITAIVPDALEFAFETLTVNTPMQGAALEMEQLPVKAQCSACEEQFQPEFENEFFMPCPKCGNEFGNRIVSGKELYIASIEAE